MPLELAGRYSAVRPIGRASAIVKRDEAGPAISYYFAEHALKLQLDYLHGWAAGDARSDRVRLQFTLHF